MSVLALLKIYIQKTCYSPVERPIYKTIECEIHAVKIRGCCSLKNQVQIRGPGGPI